MQTGMFHPIHGIDRREEVALNTRVFTGEGTPYLKVEGLLQVEGVRIASAEIPLTETREYPTDHTHRRVEAHTFPLIDVQHAQDGTAILLRSLTSNDGIWQAGEEIYVTGKWDPKVPAPRRPAPKKSRGTLLHEAPAETATAEA